MTYGYLPFLDTKSIPPSKLTHRGRRNKRGSNSDDEKAQEDSVLHIFKEFVGFEEEDFELRAQDRLL